MEVELKADKKPFHEIYTINFHQVPEVGLLEIINSFPTLLLSRSRNSWTKGCNSGEVIKEDNKKNPTKLIYHFQKTRENSGYFYASQKAVKSSLSTKDPILASRRCCQLHHCFIGGGLTPNTEILVGNHFIGTKEKPFGAFC